MVTTELVSATATVSPGPALVTSPPVTPPAKSPALDAQRFIVPGFPAIRSDGSLDEGVEAQMQGAWANLFEAMRAAGFEKHHLRNTTMYVKVGGQCQLFRRVRDRMLQRMPVPSSCLHVTELETGAPMVEIEAEARRD